GHAGDGDDRKISSLLVDRGNDVEAAGILQENVDDRGIEVAFAEGLQSRLGAVGFGHLETVDPQHHANHRANVFLVVNYENAAHQALHHHLHAKLTPEPFRCC